MTERMEPAHHVVIVGGGFGGLYAALRLRKAAVRVTLIDRRNFHLFQPLLYQVATGALSPANIASPLRGILRKQKHAAVILAEVTDFDLAGRHLTLLDHEHPLHYDTLIVATGSQFNYFGHDEWRAVAPGLKTVEDAVAIRRRVLGAFELAELENDTAQQRELMTFVVVGGGPTGVELAGAIAEVAHFTLKNDFRNINPGDARIMLFEAQDSVLGMFPPELREKAIASLRRMGVDVRTGVTVTEIHEHGVTIKRGEAHEEIPAATVLWTAGVKASSLGAKLSAAIGQSTDRGGRVTVEGNCTLPGHPEVFVIGDLANFVQDGKSLPALAPVAMQQGRYVAEAIRDRAAGRPAAEKFHYHDKGTLATIGRSSAVADLGWIKLSGFAAWITWLFVHILYLVQFQNRVLVLIQWGFNYFTRGRAARLIIEGAEDEPPWKSGSATAPGGNLPARSELPGGGGAK